MRQRRRPVTALVALVAFALSFGLPFMAPRHAWVDDPDSGWVGLPPIGAGGAPQVAAAGATSDGEHCAVCHWMRALGNSLVGLRARRPSLALSRPRPVETRLALVTTPADAGPARAPPTSIA